MSIVLDITRKGTFTCLAKNLEETHSIGETVGSQLKGRTVITLDGDLGSGKTSFVQGLAKGFNVPDNFYVTSPTYNIINEYPGRLTLYHIDLYRISDPEELYDIGFDDIVEDEAVIAIEWPNRLPPNWIKQNIAIHIKITQNDSRSFSFNIL